MDPRCIECVERSNRRLISKYNLQGEAAERFNTWYATKLSATAEPTVELQRNITRELTAITGIADLYSDEKRTSNQLALDLCQRWRPRVMQAADPLMLALKLSIAGNIMDYGAHDHFDLEATISRVITTPFAIDHTQRLREQLQQSARLLYLADNAGEIVFDRLLIETLGHPDVTVVVRGGPVLNDATLADAETAGLDQVAHVISSGLALPSTHVEQSSAEMQQHFRQADLIIAKGQGNLEGLIERNDRRIFFLLMAKCDVMAEKLGVTKGSFIVMNQSVNV